MMKIVNVLKDGRVIDSIEGKIVKIPTKIICPKSIRNNHESKIDRNSTGQNFF